MRDSSHVGILRENDTRKANPQYTQHRLRSNLSRTAVAAALLCALTFLIALVLSPYAAVYRFAAAVKHHDTETLVGMIDFDQLRYSVKPQIEELVRDHLHDFVSDKNYALALFGAKFLVDPLIDSFVCPSGLESAFSQMESHRPSHDRRLHEVEGYIHHRSLPTLQQLGLASRYVGLNEFTVHLDLSDMNAGSLDLAFSRTDLFSWQLHKIKLRECAEAIYRRELAHRNQPLL